MYMYDLLGLFVLLTSLACLNCLYILASTVLMYSYIIPKHMQIIYFILVSVVVYTSSMTFYHDDVLSSPQS